jgi:zinc protease
MITPWSLLTALAILPAPAHASGIPKADYKLKLDKYDVQIRDYTFPSGLRILFEEDHSQPIVAVTSVTDHGSGADYKGMEGMAHVIEHLAFRAKHGDLPKNMDLIKQLGGNFNAFTADDITAYMTVAPKDALVPLMKLEAKRYGGFAVAGVTQNELDLERDICRNELRQNYENGIGDAWTSLHKLLFPEGHPYRSLGIGGHESLDAITLEAVNRFTKEFYTPQYTTMVVVGDFKLDETSAIIQQVFGDMPELLRDPKNPTAPLALVEPKPRLPPKQIEPPPPVSRETVRVQGAVDRTTVVIGWSMPSGYFDNQISMNVAANMISSSITQAIDPEYDPYGPADEQPSAGCGAQPSREATIAYCFIEPPGDWTPEKTIKKAADALVGTWDTEMLKIEQYRQMNNWAFNNSKATFQSSVLRTVDTVADIGAGRATDLALFVHFTANPAYFSGSFEQIYKADMGEAREMARKYLNRERMVSVIVEPFSDEEKARRTAAVTNGQEKAAYHGTQAADDFEFAFDVQQITPETIKRVFVPPDLTKVKKLDLPNGVRVVLLPYGEAPIVRASLYLNGNGETNPERGLNAFAEALTWRGAGMREADDISQVAGDEYQSALALGTAITAEGSSGNLDAVLRTVRTRASTFDWQMADKGQQIKSWRNGMKADGKEPEVWAGRLIDGAVFGEHPLGWWNGNAVYDKMETWGAAEVKGWMYKKYQPKNATLVVVGKVDPAAAEKSIRAFFEGWKAEDGAGEPPAGTLPVPSVSTSRKVLIFDKDEATQSEINTACLLKPVQGAEKAKLDILGDAISEEYWRILREKSAVTYGAYAYGEWTPGGTAALRGYTLVQNSAVGQGVSSMIKLIENTAQGKVDEKRIASAKWTRARKYVQGQQSGGQMMNRLQSQLATGLGFEYFQTYPEALGAVKASDIADLLSPCVGHEVITVVGPKVFAEEQLKAANIPYEVVDWKGLYRAQLTPKEQEKYDESEKKKAEEKAKKASEGKK